MSVPEYASKYAHVAMKREDGILELRLHTNDGPLVWGAAPHAELGRCFADVAADREHRVVVITGTGDRFLADLDDSWVGPMTPEKWDGIFANGKRLLQNLLEIEVPVVAAVNGPASVHAELALLSDIVVASETAFFSDAPHFRHGTVPGDGVHVIWPLLLGPNRARHFLLTGSRLPASEAQRIGVVAEVVPPDVVLERAWELARDLARQPFLTLRYTRILLVHQLKKALDDAVGYGLALEGLAAYDSWPTE
jgi:enoyl-CoA hydratase/carnithine racemase